MNLPYFAHPGPIFMKSQVKITVDKVCTLEKLKKIVHQMKNKVIPLELLTKLFMKQSDFQNIIWFLSYTVIYYCVEFSTHLKKSLFYLSRKI